MAKWFMTVLAAVLFFMSAMCYFRHEAIVSADRQRIAHDNAVRQQQNTGGALFIEVNPDEGALIANAVEHGEVWFFLTFEAWACLGGIALAGTVIAFVIARRRGSRQST